MDTTLILGQGNGVVQYLIIIAVYASLFLLMRQTQTTVELRFRHSYRILFVAWSVGTFVANYLLYRAGVMSFLPWLNNFLHTFVWIGLCLGFLFAGVYRKPMVEQFALFAIYSFIVKWAESTVLGTWEHDHFVGIRGNLAYIIGWSLMDGLYPVLSFYGLKVIGRFDPAVVVGRAHAMARVLVMSALLGALGCGGKQSHESNTFWAKEQSCLADAVHAALVGDADRLGSTKFDEPVLTNPRPTPQQREEFRKLRKQYDDHIASMSQGAELANYAQYRKHAYAAAHQAAQSRDEDARNRKQLEDQGVTSSEKTRRFDQLASLHLGAAIAIDRAHRADLAGMYARRLAQAAAANEGSCGTGKP
jgi:hypothetical protein